MKRTLLIDGDVVLYQCATAVEEVYDWGDDLWSLASDARAAKQMLDSWIRRIIKKLEADNTIFTVSGSNNWRKSVLPTYKEARKGVRKPIVFAPLKDYLKNTYKTCWFDNLEGDDVLGLLAGGYNPTSRKRGKTEEFVIVTIDKDLRTIPGLHYNPNKPSLGIERVGEEEADRNHLYQTLMGDRVDGYDGCPGVGPKTADKILDKNPTWDAVVETYENKGLTEEDALVQARVARILRYGEYDTAANPEVGGEVNLWKPKETRNEQG